MCLMECGQPVYPLEIVRTMRDQRAMMIQTPVSPAHLLSSCHCLGHPLGVYHWLSAFSCWDNAEYYTANDAMLNKQQKMTLLTFKTAAGYNVSSSIKEEGGLVLAPRLPELETMMQL